MRGRNRWPVSLVCVCLLSCLLVASTRFVGSQLQKVTEASAPEPIAMASADVDGDGHVDLIAGYVEPTGGSFVVFRNSGDASNVLREVSRLQLAVHPDFIAAGDFNADGLIDVIAASRGDNALHFFEGNGKGDFGSHRAIPLTGRVTALASGEINRPDGIADLAVGLYRVEGPSVAIFSSPEGVVSAEGEDLPVA